MNDTNRAEWILRQIAQLNPKTGSIGTAVMMVREHQAARAQPERVALSDADLLFIVDQECASGRIALIYTHDDQSRVPTNIFKCLVRAILAAQASTQPVIAEAARDECIGVAQALEQSRAIMIAEAVTALQIGGATSDMPTPFQSGFQLACEEITYRLRTEMWDGCLLPIGVAITASKAKQ